MAGKTLGRRRFLSHSLLLGCSAAASPLWTPVSFAAAPWDARLVVIILRGAMDGLDVVQPWGDPAFAALRPQMPRPGTEGGPQDLDGYFALHPGLARLMPLWRAGELGFVHAVSTPYRDKRSHFTGQDILEAGVADEAGSVRSDGWLNRMLQQVPGVTAETTYAIGRGDMLLTRGDAPVSDWSPDASLDINAAALRRMDMMMHEDPLFRDNLQEAILLSGLTDGAALEGGDMVGAMAGKVSDSATPRRDLRKMAAAARSSGVTQIAAFAAEKLRGDARIASFSLSGWDTHARQDRTIAAPLRRLQSVILGLKEGLGPVWGKTGVIAMTEFGRTAAGNGTGGTDHGTGSVMLLAGGALRGGKVYGDWPSLAEEALYARRDLMPTRDVRAHAAWIMRGLFGLSIPDLEQAIFPGLEIGPAPGLVL